ncbi:hypothetical protein HN189_003464 [Escherichia coli]|nr:hypothetical protein [Escherichia coli]MBC0560357.1 hypothetical protein [Escherichia coli]HAO1176492.1 hypothetical protein [Escherichia coli]
MKSEGLTPAQLAERNAEYVTEISRLEKERAALAAENALARKAVQAFCEVVGDNTEIISELVGQDGVLVILKAMKATGNMSATDAFLAEVRAQGVDMARNAMIDFVDGEVGPNKNVPGLIRGAEICVSIAEQLRKGGSQ